MKKSIFILSIAALILFSFRNISDHRTAQVNQSQGYYIFMECTPTSEYTVLGTVSKTGVVWSGKPKEMFNIVLRRVKKDYPTADAIIFDAVDMEHATCIKFKE
ncbi:MAG TPA: hypothetical protein VGQ09_03095 [Chitinophagaceae bacterium]|jgi:hypothetical protein|nr:hypothetical protein [Chitinophagaceae bacterium]